MKIVSLLVVENGLGECCGFVFEGSAIAQVQTRLKKKKSSSLRAFRERSQR